MWTTIEKKDGHIWEIDEDTQLFRVDGEILPGEAGMAKILTLVLGRDVTPEQAAQRYRNYLAARIPPGSGKSSL